MFSAACRLSLVVASRGYPLVEVCGLRIMMASIVVEHGLSAGSDGKEFACNVGDLGSIPGLGRPPEEGKGYQLQHSGLENAMDCIVHGVAKSQTRLSNFHNWIGSSGKNLVRP